MQGLDRACFSKLANFLDAVVNHQFTSHITSESKVLKIPRDPVSCCRPNLNKPLTNDTGGPPDWVMLLEGDCNNHGDEVNMVIDKYTRLPTGV